MTEKRLCTGLSTGIGDRGVQAGKRLIPSLRIEKYSEWVDNPYGKTSVWCARLALFDEKQRGRRGRFLHHGNL